MENGLSHVLEVTPGEVACRVGSTNAPQILVAARNFAVAVLRSLAFLSTAAATRRIVMRTWEGLRLLITPNFRAPRTELIRFRVSLTPKRFGRYIVKR